MELRSSLSLPSGLEVMSFVFMLSQQEHRFATIPLSCVETAVLAASSARSFASLPRPLGDPNV